MEAMTRAVEERPAHKRRTQTILTGRSFLLGCSGLLLSISALVLVFGESARPVFEAPDIPLASAGQPPIVEREPTPAEPTPSATSPATATAKTANAGTTTATTGHATQSKPAKPGPPRDKPVAMRVWSPIGTYEEGELVTYRGSTYRALQDYTGVGDPDWITADSLWVRV